MEEQPEYTLPVVADFPVKYLTNILPTVSIFVYPLTRTGWMYTLTGVSGKSLRELLMQINWFQHLTQKWRHCKHTMESSTYFDRR